MRVSESMRRNWLLIVLAAAAALLLAYAWIDGGTEPVRTIADPIPVPGARP